MIVLLNNVFLFALMQETKDQMKIKKHKATSKRRSIRSPWDNSGLLSHLLSLFYAFSPKKERVLQILDIESGGFN
jgi:hypothetical protein